MLNSDEREQLIRGIYEQDETPYDILLFYPPQEELDAHQELPIELILDIGKDIEVLETAVDFGSAEILELVLIATGFTHRELENILPGMISNRDSFVVGEVDDKTDLLEKLWVIYNRIPNFILPDHITRQLDKRTLNQISKYKTLPDDMENLIGDFL